MKLRNIAAACAVVAMVGFVSSEAFAGPGCGSATAKKTGSSCGTVEKASAGCAGHTATANKSCCPSGKATVMNCGTTEIDCAKWMRDHYKKKGWLGVELQMDGHQPVVTRVVEKSPAAASGFQVGDKLTSVNGVAFTEENQPAIQEMMKEGFKVGQKVPYTVVRGEETVTLEPKLAKISKEQLEEMIAAHMSSAQHKPADKAENLDR